VRCAERGRVVELFHLPGTTPEAPTLAAAFGTARAPEPIRYGQPERRAVYADLNSQGTSTDVDFVLLGCPHASVEQIRRAARALDGRRLSEGTEQWLMAPRALKDVADRSGSWLPASPRSRTWTPIRAR
jgi:predicted aconitase